MDVRSEVLEMKFVSLKTVRLHARQVIKYKHIYYFISRMTMSIRETMQVIMNLTNYSKALTKHNAIYKKN